MREIIFKAKRIDNGEWVEGHLIQSPYMGEVRSWISTPNDKTRLRAIATYYGDWRAVEVCTDTICQYTGLTDENGNKIWENDIVRYMDELVLRIKEDLVKWNETHASFVRLHESKMGLQYLYIDECIARRCEVIGNIFDNPELLEGSE